MRSVLLRLLVLVLACSGASCISTRLAPLQKGNERLEEDEQRIWNRSLEEEALLDKSKIMHGDTALTAYLNAVARKLCAQTPQAEKLTIRVQVIDNPLLNAFTYPNGVIYVHTGILAKMESEAQLATLLGHEMTHATHRHAVRNFRNVKNNAAFLTFLSIGTLSATTYGSLANLLGEIGALASISGYSQEMETEADNSGFLLMRQAGYDPREAPKLFELIGRDLEDEDESEPFFFGSHPHVRSRIESYNKLLKKIGPETTGVVGTAEFARHALPLILVNTEMDLSLGRVRSAERSLDRYAQFDTMNGAAHFYRGQLEERREEGKTLEAAEHEYARAVELQPDFAPAYKALGLLHMKQGKNSEARAELEKYLALAPGAADRKFIEHYLHTLHN